MKTFSSGEVLQRAFELVCEALSGEGEWVDGPATLQASFLADALKSLQRAESRKSVLSKLTKEEVDLLGVKNLTEEEAAVLKLAVPYSE